MDHDSTLNEQHRPADGGKVAASKPRTYVLVHGAWFGGWIWDEMAAALRAKGHIVYAPCLTGLGEKRSLIRPGINLTTHANDVVELIEQEELDDVVLVGWSYGGMVISEVLARIPDRIGAMVYLDAFVPERGRSAMDYTSNLTGSDEALEEQRDAAERYKHMTDDLEPSSFDIMGITDTAIIERLAPRLSPHPIGTFTQPSGALERRPGHIPHLYVLAESSPTSALFGPIRARLAGEPDFRTMGLPTSHLMMVTAHEEVLHILETL